MSWDEAYAERYDEWSAHMTADIPFYVGLASRSDGPLIELAVGNGRVAIPAGQATGRRVIGIDRSPAMLRQARLNAERAGVDIELREGDVRDLAVTELAALIYCPFRALLHLPTWADRRPTFERVAAALRPGGRFAWNAFAFDHRVAARLDGVPQADPVPHTIRYAVGDNRVDIRLDDGAVSSLWWATKNEWLGLLESPSWTWRRFMAGLTGNRSTMTAVSTYSSHVVPDGSNDGRGLVPWFGETLRRLQTPASPQPRPAEDDHRPGRNQPHSATRLSAPPR